MIDLSTIAFRKQLVGKYATKYGLDAALICALIEHESTWSMYALRFEQQFYNRYESSLKVSATEAYSRAFSWGLMQIMGQTARELGFTGKFLSELTNPDVGVEYGCRKLQRCIKTTANEREALLHYNGGSDPQYPDLVLQFKSKYL